MSRDKGAGNSYVHLPSAKFTKYSNMLAKVLGVSGTARMWLYGKLRRHLWVCEGKYYTYMRNINAI